MGKVNFTEKELKGFRTLVDIAVTSSNHFSDEFPKWLRPFGKFISFLLILIFMILMTPFFLIKRRLPNTYKNLETDLNSLWHSESSLIALHKLRDIQIKLNKQSEKVMLGGYKIEPYGKFNFYDFSRVCHLHYHWEIQHQCYNEAINICDEMLKPGIGSNDFSRIYADWIINKARAIRGLNGQLAALEYLLQHIDRNNEKCRIKEYFNELKVISHV